MNRPYPLNSVMALVDESRFFKNENGQLAMGNARTIRIALKAAKFPSMSYNVEEYHLVRNAMDDLPTCDFYNDYLDQEMFFSSIEIMTAVRLRME